MSEQNVERSKRTSAKKRIKNCGSKETFITNESAQKTAGHMNSNGKYVKPYKCGVCKQWHLTSRGKRGILSDLFKQLEHERKHGVRLSTW